jgi:tetratricopeptide (TPR) repeat protein
LYPDILKAPHLDLLPVARRLWRARLPSCALSSLEQNILDVRRDGRDVPGFLIPDMYFRYVQSGDASEIQRVFYHNAQDILSLVTLASRMATLFNAPSEGRPVDGSDMLSLGRLCERLGLIGEAERAYQHALRDSVTPQIRATIEGHLAFVYKRTGRWEEAVALWEKLRASQWADVVPHVELAKYYEHRRRDHEYALALALEARERLTAEAHDLRTLSELDHRLARLRRKLERRNDPASG